MHCWIFKLGLYKKNLLFNVFLRCCRLVIVGIHRFDGILKEPRMGVLCVHGIQCMSVHDFYFMAIPFSLEFRMSAHIRTQTVKKIYFNFTGCFHNIFQSRQMCSPQYAWVIALIKLYLHLCLSWFPFWFTFMTLPTILFSFFSVQFYKIRKWN